MTARRRVLIIDDDIIFRQAIAKLLERTGYASAETCACAKTASVMMQPIGRTIKRRKKRQRLAPFEWLFMGGGK